MHRDEPSSQSWMLIILLMFAAGFAVAAIFVVLILAGVLGPQSTATGVIP